MDTRFWGPSGWNLLHSIAGQYPNKPTNIQKKQYYMFYNSLPIILPCIYCRRSLEEYYNILPLNNNILKKKEKLITWLYNLHNLVNNKLRKQGLTNLNDPKIDTIIKKYNKPNCCTIQKCKNFLYSIAMNYPIDDDLITLKLKQNYLIFFNNLTNIYPNKIISKKLANFNKEYPIYNFLNNRNTLFKWVYMWEKIINNNCPCLNLRLKETSKFIAGCKGKGNEKPTCRINI